MFTNEHIYITILCTYRHTYIHAHFYTHTYMQKFLCVYFFYSEKIIASNINSSRLTVEVTRGYPMPKYISFQTDRDRGFDMK